MDQVSLKDIPREKGYPIAHLLRISNVELKLSKKETEYLQMTLSDSTTEVKYCKKWDASKDEFDRIKEWKLAFITGKTEIYNDKLQISCDSIAAPDPTIDVTEMLYGMLPKSAYEPDFLKREIWKFIKKMENKWIKDLILLFLADPEVKEKLPLAYAAVSFHHPYRHGLCTHIVRLMYLADSIVDAFNNNMYPGGTYKVNKDLVMAGCFLHDLYKIQEYNLDGSYAEYGNLVPHLPKSAIEINRKADLIPGFPEELRTQLTHIVLSHHGELDFGSPVTPSTVEAVLFSFIDNMASKIDPMLEALDAVSDNWSSDKLRGINKKAYRGGMLTELLNPVTQQEDHGEKK